MEPPSPRFRRDLVVANTEANGVPCVDVRDPSTGTSFRFYDFEYQLALQLDGQPLGDVTAWASTTYGVDIDQSGVAEFAGRLAELGFLELLEPAAAEALDGAEAEWMSPQAAKTAQFVPDASMLDGSVSDRTPMGRADAVPLDAPEPDTARAVSEDAAASAVADSSPLTLPNPVTPTPPAAPPSDDAGRSGWARDLDGVSPGAAAAPLAAAAEALSPVADAPALSAAGVTTSPAPAGLPERRQPPKPDAVSMAGFADERARPDRARPRRLGRALLFVALLIAAGVIGYIAVSRERASAPQSMRVRVFAPKPTAVYRWFAAEGVVADAGLRALAFDGAGRLAESLPPGTVFAAGDVLGKLQGAAALEASLEHNQSRLGFYRQLRDSMRAADNEPELRQAELRLDEKQRLVDDATAGLAKLVVRASEPGEVIAALAKVGAAVKPGEPVMRVKGQRLHGVFALEADAAAEAAKLDFCRVEVAGAERADSPEGDGAPRFFDCQFQGATGAGGAIEVSLPADAGLMAGQTLRLARRRYDAVFPVPARALADDGDRKSVWIASRAGVAEQRPVALADIGNDALVSGGLHVGDEVILDPRPGLRSGVPVTPIEIAILGGPRPPRDGLARAELALPHATSSR